ERRHRSTRRTVELGHAPSASVEVILILRLIRMGSTGIPLGDLCCRSFRKEGLDVKPMAAALTGALIAGVGMYAIGARAQDQFAMNAGLPGNVPISYFASPQPVAQQPVAYAPVYAPAPQRVVYRQAAAPRQTVSRTTEP